MESTWNGGSAWLARGGPERKLNQCISCSLSTNDGRVLLKWLGEKAQEGQNYLVVTDEKSQGSFFIVTAEVSTPLYVTSGLQLYVQLSCARKKLLREASVLEEARSPPISAFIGHGYAQHAGRKWREEHCVPYHSFLIPKNYDLLDAKAFAHEDSTFWSSRGVVVSLDRDLDQQKGDPDAYVVTRDRSDKGPDSEKNVGCLRVHLRYRNCSQE